MNKLAESILWNFAGWIIEELLNMNLELCRTNTVKRWI